MLLPLPENTADEFIVSGLAKGFEMNKCKVMLKKIDELTSDDIKAFNPDLILGYNHSFLNYDESCKKMIEGSNCKKFAFYLVDESSGEFVLNDDFKKFKPKIFVADKSFLAKIKNSIYLPLAINPRKYLTDFSGYKYCISFMGAPLGDACQSILCELVKVFKTSLNIFSSEKDFSKSIKEIKSKGLLAKDDLRTYSKCRHELVKSESEFAEIFNSTKINLSINPHDKSSVSYRMLEILASGGFLITSEIKDLGPSFKESKHFETFRDSRDLIDKIDFYLSNLNIAQKIAQLGKFEVIDSYTFGARAKSILKAAAI